MSPRGIVKKQPAPSTASLPTFQWQGKEWSVDSNALFSSIRSLGTKKLPKEALRFKDWYVLVDEQKVSIKWLFYLITGANYNEFDATTARKKLSEVNIQAHRVENTPQMDRPGSEKTPPIPIQNYAQRLDKAQRDHLFGEIGELLPSYLPEAMSDIRTIRFAGANYLQFYSPKFPRSHYELIFSRGYYRFAFHMEGQVEFNIKRMELARPMAVELSQIWNYQVTAEPWGNNCAHVYLDVPEDKHVKLLTSILDEYLAPTTVPKQDLLEKTAQQVMSRSPDFSEHHPDALLFAELMVQFIVATYDHLVEIFTSTPSDRRRTRRPPASLPSSDASKLIYSRVDDLVNQINRFLSGRATEHLSDEQLCNWIFLCYTLQLNTQGQQLFEYVNPETLNNEWLYNRTKRFASACRLAAKSDG